MDDVAVYDLAAAKEHVLKRFREQGDFCIFKDQLLEDMVDKILSLDQEYTEAVPEDSYYDDDEAFGFLLDGMQKAFPEQKMYMMRFTEDYMDYNEEYLDQNGLIDWD